MNKKMNKLLIFSMISIVFLFLPIMVQAGVPTPPKSKQYDLITYDYIITDDFEDVIEEQYDLIVNLTLKEDWHYYLEGMNVGDNSAYKDKDDYIHTFYVKQIISYEGTATPDSESGPNLLDSIIATLTGFTMEELIIMIIIGIVILWILSHLRM